MCSAAWRFGKLAMTTRSCSELTAGSGSRAIQASSLTERPRSRPSTGPMTTLAPAQTPALKRFPRARKRGVSGAGYQGG